MTVAGLTRFLVVVAAGWVSLASTTEAGSEDGWRLGAQIDAPPVELGAGNNYVGHFTLIRRNAPLHDLEASIDLALTYTGSPDRVFVVASIVPDIEPGRVNFGSTSQFPVRPDEPANDHVLRGIDLDATCIDECIDGFSVFVDRVSGSTEGTITVVWSGGGHIDALEGDEPDDVQFELRLD